VVQQRQNALSRVAGSVPRMTATVRGFTTGWLTTDLAGLLEGGEGQIRIPVLSYLVEHADGTLVFDTGLHTDMRIDPGARIGRLADYFASELAPDTAVHERTATLEIEPDMVVCSHLHFDHCGGNALLGDVPIVVQRTEWDAAHGGDPSAAYLPADFDTGQDVRLVDGEHDVFGDGSVVCIPTPGHTAGHQSLRVRTASREVLLTGDACYFRESLETSKLPLFSHDREQQLRTFGALRALEAAGAHLVFGHDPAQWTDDTPQPL
jgi:glyoxylase-like metal-dependent hydrolase (beta-lactamase superfamily II)